jgi:hypothetical protein
MKSKLSLLPHIERKYKTDVFYYEGALTLGGARRLRESIDATALQHANRLLILDTTEGSVESAWQMISALKGPYGDHELTLYVPGSCTGPGALLAIAADTIILDDAGRIGQISGSQNSNVLSAKNAMRGLKVLRSELPDVELAAAAIGQLDLKTIGQQEREIQLARNYAAGFAPFYRQRLVESLLGNQGGPSPLFGWADLSRWTNVIQPSNALVDFVRYIKWDIMESGLAAPHAILLSSGGRAPRSKRQRSGVSRAGGEKAA